MGRDTTPSPLTSTPSFDADPVWSPDGEAIAFSSYRNGKWGLWKKNISAGQEELLWEAAEGTRSLIPMDWSPDGEFILFDRSGIRDVWVLPVSGDDPWPLFNDPNYSERAAHFSPDGEWVAYISGEAGADSIYLARFPAGTDGQRVSDGGSSHPRWSGDGGELFYRGRNDVVMTVRVEAGDSGLDLGTPVQAPIPAMRTMQDGRHNYAVTGDGNSFLLRRPSLDPPPVTIIVNWTAELQDQ